MTRILTTITALVFAAGMLHAQDTKEIVLKPDETNPLSYDANSKTFTVKAGEKIKVTLDNTSMKAPQPHNLLICKPASYNRVVAEASKLMVDPQAMAKGYVPESPDILHHTKLLQPGSKETLEFTAPTEPGDYEYLCTFPGHWLLMKGVMKVEK